MTEQQRKLVDVLAWFHKVCEKYELRYYIIAGTMLGAVRHGGFIPWDDDIDVGMPRSDYERLRELAKDMPEKEYLFEFPGDESPEVSALFAKIYDTSTTLIEKRRYPIKRGIYIDIFPLDGIGNTMDEARRNYRPFYRNFALYLTITSAFLKRRSLKKNLAVLVGRFISPLFVKRRRLAKKVETLCKRFDFDESVLVSNLLGGAAYKGIVPRDYFGTPTMIAFEGLLVYGLEKPELYLSSMYGDYMKLPPEEKRISLHDASICDLDKSFLDT